MSVPEQIVCKPTPWFALRATAMLAMFSVFAMLFYIDGTTGYRKKNLEFYLNATFREATAKFSEMNAKGDLTPEMWKDFAEKQNVRLPADPSLVPAGTELPLPWPPVLADFAKVKAQQPHLLWQEYSGKNGMSNKVAEHPFDAGKIREQIIVFYICLALALAALFILIRTSRRSIRADSEALTIANGHRIPYASLKTLDLRKWDTKGIALIEHDDPSGSGRARLDGLTYGGFKREADQPAERLMARIRENFSGEIIEYTTTPEGSRPDSSDGD